MGRTKIPPAIDFLNFLMEARLATYLAGRPADRELDNTEVQSYIRRPWTYTDRYRGFESFRGIEQVTHSHGPPCWTMHYQGLVIPGASLSPDEIFRFLKDARRNSCQQGYILVPEGYYDSFGTTGRLCYEDRCHDGDLDPCSGTEKILRGSGPVQELLFIMHYAGRLTDA